MKQIYEFDLSSVEPMENTGDIYEGRTLASQMLQQISKVDSEVTVIVTGYNRIEKTKRCVESVLKYTSDVDYDLILIDNGSSDGTFEYFKTVEHDKLRIIRLNKNRGLAPPACLLNLNWFANYLVSVPNDLIVTENWLSNLLKVAKSDPKIGMVNPVSSNTSNLQYLDFEFSDYEDMQEKAKKLNVSDPRKWEERIRLITLGTLYKKECMYALGWPNADIGFTHDFGDDDITFRVRRLGYKAILAGDTWIHHDHDIRNMEDKDPVKFAESINSGRQNFMDKYFGIDAWDDVNNYVFPILNDHIAKPKNNKDVRILGVDVKCGTPILDIKNRIRRFGAFEAETSAFFEDSKYDIDLRTICSGSVICKNIDYLYNSFAPDYFDYIIIDRYINEYYAPSSVIQDAYSLLKKGGQLFVKLKNTHDVCTLLKMLGYNINTDNIALHCGAETFVEAVTNMGIGIENIHVKNYNFAKEVKEMILKLAGTYKSADVTLEEIFKRMMANEYWFKITK